MNRRALPAMMLWCAALFVASAAFAQENLDEMLRRRGRRATNPWPRDLLEDETSGFAWQPETLCYTDVTTGREVWRMTDTPDIRNYYHNDIAMSPWSADGRCLGLQSWRESKALKPSSELRNLWMVVNADGSRMRPTVNNDGYMHWSPLLPDVYYTFGGTRIAGVTTGAGTLYEVTVADDGPATTMRALLDYGAPQKISKMISTDGKMIVAIRSDFSVSPYQNYYTPTVIEPGGGATALLATGYTVNREFGDYCPPFDKGHYHDKYLLGDGTYYYAIDRDIGFWRLKTVGSAPDGGPLFTGDNGSHDFGEVIPEYVRGLGALDDPWEENQYPGHPGFDRWGRLVAIANYDSRDEQGNFKIGVSVYDFIHHQTVTGSWIPQTDGATHCDWSAYSDCAVVSIEESAYSCGPARIEVFPYDQRGQNEIVCYTHNWTHGGSAYYNYIRPAQSPDGTKVAWHSDFLNGTDVPDCYWAVCYMPEPATGLAASASTGGIELTWRMPSYTARGWPDADDDPPPAREVARFHVWRATSAEGPWRHVGVVEPTHAANLERSIMEPGGLQFADDPGDGTWYYALTGEEWSRLESDELSEILQVRVVEGAVAAQVVAPAGQKGFWSVAPDAPGDLCVVPTTTPGRYHLSWSEPADDMIRYYNLYYATDGLPAVDQSARIASLPPGTTAFIDWLADPDNAGYYRITAVDRYGNEGFILPGDANDDGRIDSADLALWQQNYDPAGASPRAFSAGDWNGDGRTDSADLALWQQNYNPLGAGAAGGTESVPEPATVVLLGFGALLLRFRKRRADHA